MRHFFNNYKVVQFDDSRYGIRKGRIFYVFVDIEQPQFAWPQWHRFYLTDCRSSNLQEVILLYNKLRVKGYKILDDAFMHEANAKDHRAGGSGASPCWADSPIDNRSDGLS